MRAVLAQGRAMLTEPEAKELLAAYGIPVVATPMIAWVTSASRPGPGDPARAGVTGSSWRSAVAFIASSGGEILIRRRPDQHRRLIERSP